MDQLDSNQKEVSEMLSKLNKITFIGGGNISTAIISSLVKVVPSRKITVVDRNISKLQNLEEKFNINYDMDYHSAISDADSILLCVKPQDMKKLGDSIHSKLEKQSPLIISVAAGIQLQSLAHWFGGHLPIVRSMPNTPSAVGEGMTLLYSNELVSKQQKLMSEQFMRAVGKTVWLDQEEDMNAGVATSGSGPGYVFMFMDKMIESAKALGLPDHTARTLVLQTFLGASKLAMESEDTPGELQKKVTSKGGTTAAALNVFSNEKFGETFHRAMQAASKRSAELGSELGADNSSHLIKPQQIITSNAQTSSKTYGN